MGLTRPFRRVYASEGTNLWLKEIPSQSDDNDLIVVVDFLLVLEISKEINIK